MLLVLALLPATAFAQRPDLDADTARREITEVYRLWGDARVKRDRAAIEKLVAPDFYAQIFNQRMTRDEFINEVLAPGQSSMKRFETRILTLQRKADVWQVVITEKLEFEFPGSDGALQHFYGLWITRDGWRKDGSGWVSTFTEALGNENWSHGKRPPFPDWSR